MAGGGAEGPLYPPERQEHIFLQAGQDHGIGVRLSCTSDVTYLDPAPHQAPNTNAFDADGLPEAERTITLSILTPHNGAQQTRVKHGQCITTTDGSQKYTCNEPTPSGSFVCDTRNNIHPTPCTAETQTLTL